MATLHHKGLTMATRKTLPPYVAFDDLELGVQYKIKRHGMAAVKGVLVEMFLSDNLLWLNLQTSKTRTLLFTGQDIEWSDGWALIELV